MRALARLGIAALVIAAVVALWWLDTVRQAPEVDTADTAARHEPDSYFTAFRLRAHDGAGHPGYVLDGERLVRFADDGSAKVTAPRLRYRPDAGQVWRARGNNGLLGPAGERLDIDGEVVLVREADAGIPVVIKTTRLTVHTGAGRAETDRPVAATGPGWRASATGMTARFDAGEIELHADVRMHHEGGVRGDG